MAEGAPKTIQIYLPQGNPRGIRMAELTTRIVRVVEVPRDLLDSFSSMIESSQVGIYFLVGQESETDTNLLYIGHTGDVVERIKQHREKMFWNRALVAVTPSNALTQTHTQYLEWRSILEARNAGRYSLQNGTAGSKPHTPAPLEADCLEIFDTIATLMATLGAPVFEPLITKQNGSRRGASAMGKLLYCKASGADGTGYYSDDGLVVLKGSSGRRETVPSMKGTSDERVRELLIQDGVLRLDGERVVFEKDHLFTAPSRAVIALAGVIANGWVVWKDAEGKTLKQLRQSDASIDALSGSHTKNGDPE